MKRCDFLRLAGIGAFAAWLGFKSEEPEAETVDETPATETDVDEEYFSPYCFRGGASVASPARYYPPSPGPREDDKESHSIWGVRPPEK